MHSESSDINPFIGPRPFENTSQHRRLFYGRNREIRDLLALVIAQRTLLLYGKSGTGKTSLINAAIRPMLEDLGYDVLPPARVRGEMNPAADNIYVYNVLLGWADTEASSDEILQWTLSDFLANRPRLEREDGTLAPRVILFDQFEEMFTFYPQRWPDRNDFFEQVDEALQAAPSLRAVFIMREDYIAELDSETFESILPNELTTRFRLESLSHDQAIAAVEGPLKNTDRQFAEGAAKRLVDDMMTLDSTPAGQLMKEQFVEPVVLQVVCRRMWRALPGATTVIGEKEIEEYARVSNALSMYYEDCVQSVIDTSLMSSRSASGAKVNLNEVRIRLEGDIRRWFGTTLIKEYVRDRVFRGAETVGGLPNDLVQVFEDQFHIIRGESVGQRRWYELVHDRFIEPILESNSAWEQKQAALRVAQERAKTIRRTRLYVGALALMGVLLIFGTWVANNAQSEQDILAGTATSIALEQATVASNVLLQQTHAASYFDGGVIPPVAQSILAPEDFLATVTRIAQLNAWEPTFQPFDRVEMVQVPPGCFFMGSNTPDAQPNERPVTEICFQEPFWIDRYEVTNGQFLLHEGTAIAPSGSPGPDLPRSNVTWQEARDFCERRGARLPTEAEWEYAARGPSSLKYPWGNTFVPENVVYHANSGDAPAPVGSRPGGTSWVGAYDMIGNVAEWVNTIYDDEFFPYPYAAGDGREKPDVPQTLRVLRGNSYLSRVEHDLRAASRSGGDPEVIYPDVGFRCTRTE